MSIAPAPILAHLGLPALPPDLDSLNRVLRAWSTRLPWESASRIARHQSPGRPEDYARAPEAFFADALRWGTGGTCFESNSALKALLEASGFRADMTFCAMETATVDPHCALVVPLDGQVYLADVGFPVSAALRLDPGGPTTIQTPVYRFTAEPDGPGRWAVRRFSGSYASLCFWIQADDPVDADRFRARLLRDHAPDGLFLDEVIVHRLDGEQVWYFSERRGLVRRTRGREDPLLITDRVRPHLDAVLSRFFRMDRAVIRAALDRLHRQAEF